MSHFKASSEKKFKSCMNLRRCWICQKQTPESLSEMSEMCKSRFCEALEARRDELYYKYIHEYKSLSQLIFVGIHVHKTCYKSYTSKQNLTVFSKEQQSRTEKHVALAQCQKDTNAVSTRSKSLMIEAKTCFLCRKEINKGKRSLHTLESLGRLNLVLNAAKEKADFELATILQNGNVEKLLYHNSCLLKYMPKGKTTQEYTEEIEYEDAYRTAFSKLTYEIDYRIIVQRQTFQMSELLHMVLSHLPDNVPKTFDIRRLGRWLEQHFGDQIRIKSQKGQGKSNIIVSSSFSIGDAVRSTAAEMLQEPSFIDVPDSSFNTPNLLTEQQILHRAASILRRDICEVKPNTDKYPSPNDVSLNNSTELIPENLRNFLMWLLDEKSFSNVESQTTVMNDKLRKCLALSECIISISRDSFTPFYLALALYVHHELGSKQFIDILNSNGLCASYTEVRRFLTSVADTEMHLQMEAGVYVPSGIRSVANGGLLIQEGADNIDVNAETIDGKNTFHSMARAVFQETEVSQGLFVDENRVVTRGNERSLKHNESAETTLKSLPFQKPAVRAEPRKQPSPVDAILSAQVSTESEKDKIWVLIRGVHRSLVPNMTCWNDSTTDQTVPFWTGFHVAMSNPKPLFHAVSYPPIIDDRPSDMSTVYTTMKRCLDMTKQLGQTYAIQTFDQQLYAIAQQIKWANPEVFNTLILRLGGFHMLSCFIATLGKLWGDGGLRDLLTDSGLYAGNSVDQILSGKQFNRATRALTLLYEALTTLQMRAFFQWSSDTDCLTAIPTEVWDVLRECKQKFDESVYVKEAVNKFGNLYAIHLHPLVEEFRGWGRSKSPTFKYWDMLLQAIQTRLY